MQLSTPLKALQNWLSNCSLQSPKNQWKKKKDLTFPSTLNTTRLDMDHNISILELMPGYKMSNKDEHLVAHSSDNTMPTMTAIFAAIKYR